MAILTIKRPSTFVNGYRNYTVKVDGKTVGSISDGQTKEFTLDKGAFKVTAHMDWYSSNPVYIDTNERQEITLQVKPFKLTLLTITVVVASIIGSVFGYFVLKTPLLLLLLFPAILYIVYLITMGRKKYLVLTQIP